MSKPYYEEYSNRALRFYARNPALKMSAPGLKKPDVENWMACNDVLRGYASDERDIIIEVYRLKTTMPESVFTVAAKHNRETAYVWQLLIKATRDFAKKRGLI